MNSDDIYKFIGYAVVIVFGFYIVSRSLKFQTKIIEGMTRAEERELEEKEEQERIERVNLENKQSSDLNNIIREIQKFNNKNLNNLKKYNSKNYSYIEELNKYTNNYILREKINILEFLIGILLKVEPADINRPEGDKKFINTAEKINYNSIIDGLEQRINIIESLQNGIVYLSETTSGDLEEEIKEDDNEDDSGFGVGYSSDDDNNDGDDNENITVDKTTVEALKLTNEKNTTIINDDIKYYSRTQSKLKNSLINLLITYKTEQKIYLANSIIEKDNRDIYAYNTSINILEKTENVLTELFGGSIGGSTIGKNKSKKKGKGMFKK